MVAARGLADRLDRDLNDVDPKIFRRKMSNIFLKQIENLMMLMGNRCGAVGIASGPRYLRLESRQRKSFTANCN